MNALFPNIMKCSTYFGDVTPDEHTIFVFGSNTEGRHGAGAAKIAREQFGAKYGQAMGLQGSSYAIITKDLRQKTHPSVDKETIICQFVTLLAFAEENPSERFMLAYRNVGDKKSLCGYSGKELMLMFEEALGRYNVISNVFISGEWHEEAIADFMRNM